MKKSIKGLTKSAIKNLSTIKGGDDDERGEAERTQIRLEKRQG